MPTETITITAEISAIISTAFLLEIAQNEGDFLRAAADDWALTFDPEYQDQNGEWTRMPGTLFAEIDPDFELTCDDVDALTQASYPHVLALSQHFRSPSEVPFPMLPEGWYWFDQQKARTVCNVLLARYGTRFPRQDWRNIAGIDIAIDDINEAVQTALLGEIRYCVTESDDDDDDDYDDDDYDDDDDN